MYRSPTAEERVFLSRNATCVARFGHEMGRTREESRLRRNAQNKENRGRRQEYQRAYYAKRIAAIRAAKGTE